MSGQTKRRRLHHFLDQTFLQKLWDEEGDLEAKGILQDIEHLRDICTNPHTQIAEPQICLAPRFWLRFNKNSSGRVRMWLEMDRAVTVEKIKDHWDEIRLFQDLLRDLQGPEKSDRGCDRYILLLHRRHKRGVSYAALTESVARDAFSWIEWYWSQKITEFKKALPNINHWSDQERNHWASECSAALQLFRIAGAKDEVLIEAWWIAALKYFSSKSKRPIKADVPVTRDNIIETLKGFRKRFVPKDGVEKIG